MFLFHETKMTSNARRCLCSINVSSSFGLQNPLRKHFKWMERIVSCEKNGTAQRIFGFKVESIRRQSKISSIGIWTYYCILDKCPVRLIRLFRSMKKINALKVTTKRSKTKKQINHLINMENDDFDRRNWIRPMDLSINENT